MDEKGNIAFEKKVIAEIRKRKDIVVKADEMVQKIEQHYIDKKVENECVNVERNEVINQIYGAAKEKDISKLDSLFERLR